MGRGDLRDSGVPSRWDRSHDNEDRKEAENGGGVNDVVMNRFSKRPPIQAEVYNPDEENSRDSRNKNLGADTRVGSGLQTACCLRICNKGRCARIRYCIEKSHGYNRDPVSAIDRGIYDVCRVTVCW